MRSWYRLIWDLYPKPCFLVQNGCQIEHTRRRPCKISTARKYDGASLFSSRMEEKLLKTSMAYSTMKASEFLSHLPSDLKQKAATALLRDVIQIRDFAAPIAARASKIFGPISRHLIEQILRLMCNEARPSRPGVAVGIPRVLCTSMCTAQRFHMDGEEQRIELDVRTNLTLSHITMNSLFSTTSSPLLGRTLRSFLVHAILFHDLITQIFPRSLQYGIVVCLSSWTYCWFSAHPLQRAMYGSKISR